MTTKVFVYGTLMSGEGNHRLLARARLVGPARTLPGFSLFDLGAFPGMIAGGTSAVAGEVYEVDDATLARLDRLEGHPRWYERTAIVLENGASVQTYLLPPDEVEGRRRIVSGCWRTHRKDRAHEDHHA